MIINKSQIMQLMQIAQNYNGDLCTRKYDDEAVKDAALEYANHIGTLLAEIAIQQSKELYEIPDNNVVDLKVVK